MSTEKDVAIRPASRSDLEQIIAADPLAQASTTRQGLILQAVKAGWCHLAAKNGILGFVILEYSFFGYGFVTLLVVHPEHRRQGVGSVLMLYLESICTTGKLFTSTNESNLPMQALLEKLGYQPSGIIYGLDEGDPELVFRKELRQKII